MTPVDLAVAHLSDPRTASPASSFPADRDAAAHPGLYAWWADETALDALARVLGQRLNGPIYVGQAGATRWPSGTRSAATVASRIRSQHIGGNASSSTFRLTIASLLVDELALQLDAPGVLTSASNAIVTTWIREHLAISVLAYDDRDTLGEFEHEVVTRLDPPLNLEHCAPTPIRRTLTRLRAQFNTGRASPINAPGPEAGANVSDGAAELSAPSSATPSPRSEHATGHLFVIDGDLTRLHCDAVLVPVDDHLKVEEPWERLVTGDLADLEPPDGWGFTVRAFRYRTQPGLPDVWLGCIGASEKDGRWYAVGLVEFVRRASSTLAPPADRPLRVAVNLAGSGVGGSAHNKGQLARAIVPALQAVAEETGTDVVLVCFGEKPYAAVQRVRQQLDRPSPWAGESEAERLDTLAHRLADSARAGELVLFIGAGVSIGAGLPSWDKLLDDLVRAADFEPHEAAAIKHLDVQDQAQLIRKRIGDSERYERTLLELLDVKDRYSLMHGLLASLGTIENVTTNYDRLFELAARTAGRECAVLPYEAARARHRWLLKLHGSVDRPGDIVLTRSDYLSLPMRSTALFGILQAMLLTRHILFVGYSLKDESFHKVMHEVRLARGAGHGKLGTALLLESSPLLADLFDDDLHIESCSQPAPPDADRRLAVGEQVRRLELLLDRVALLACDASSYLLDPTYRSLLDTHEAELADCVGAAFALARSSSGPIADGVRAALRPFTNGR